MVMQLFGIIIIIEGILLGLTTFKLRKPEYDGVMVVMDTEDKKTFSLEINTDPDKLDQKKQIVLKVTNVPS